MLWTSCSDVKDLAWKLESLFRCLDDVHENHYVKNNEWKNKFREDICAKTRKNSHHAFKGFSRDNNQLRR